MTDKENALRIIKFDSPERIMPGMPAYEVAFHGCHHEGFGPGGHDSPVGTKWVDIWGTGWHKEQEGIMGYPYQFPIAEVEKLDGYQWPDPNDERICGKIYRLAGKFPGGDVFLMGSHRNLLWEKAYKLVGMEDLMVYFYTDPEFVKEVFHRIMDFHMAISKHYLKVGVEYVYMTEDLGSQNGPLFSPAIMEEFFIPEYERIFKLYREKGIIIEFHSCGNIESMLDMLMNLGVDILNPIQKSANDLKHIREVTQGRMALRCGISSDLLMKGPAERIIEQARDTMWLLGQNGGYFCAPDQGMPFPEKHMNALNEVIKEYGKYPLVNPAK